MNKISVCAVQSDYYNYNTFSTAPILKGKNVGINNDWFKEILLDI